MTDEISFKIERLRNNIGHTPTVNIGYDVYGKLESKNPAGSVKDRAAFYMVADALFSGKLNEEGTIVEATSGNTGIGLAYIAKELGIKCCIVMPESMSEQRRKMILRYGAKLILTPAGKGMAGAVEEAKRIEKEDGAWLANQFSNYACVDAHYETTAPEIFSAFPNAEYIVAGVGSGGTAMGIKKYIVQNKLNCKVVAVEPSESPLMSKGFSGAHKIQGIGANFIPDIVDTSCFDKIMTVCSDDAVSDALELYKNYGCKCGISSGAAYNAAKRLRAQTEGIIVAILPDSGDRYSIFDC